MTAKERETENGRRQTAKHPGKTFPSHKQRKLLDISQLCSATTGSNECVHKSTAILHLSSSIFCPAQIRFLPMALSHHPSANPCQWAGNPLHIHLKWGVVHTGRNDSEANISGSKCSAYLGGSLGGRDGGFWGTGCDIDVGVTVECAASTAGSLIAAENGGGGSRGRIGGDKPGGMYGFVACRSSSAFAVPGRVVCILLGRLGLISRYRSWCEERWGMYSGVVGGGGEGEGGGIGGSMRCASGLGGGTVVPGK